MMNLEISFFGIGDDGLRSIKNFQGFIKTEMANKHSAPPCGILEDDGPVGLESLRYPRLK
jgi:hypothetical protein